MTTNILKLKPIRDELAPETIERITTADASPEANIKRVTDWLRTAQMDGVTYQALVEVLEMARLNQENKAEAERYFRKWLAPDLSKGGAA